MRNVRECFLPCLIVVIVVLAFCRKDKDKERHKRHQSKSNHVRDDSTPAKTKCTSKSLEPDMWHQQQNGLIMDAQSGDVMTPPTTSKSLDLDLDSADKSSDSPSLPATSPAPSAKTSASKQD